MNRKRLLRILILADVFSMVAGGIAAAIFERTLPAPLRGYASSEELHPVLLVAGVFLLVLLISAWVGLWRNARWAPGAYMVMWIACFILVPFAGPYVATGIEEMFDFAGSTAEGGILALLFLDMAQRRNAGRAAFGEPTDSEPLPHETGRENLEPNIKSFRVHRALSVLYGLIALMLLALPYVAQSGEEALTAGEMAIAALVPLFFFALAAVHYFVSRGAKTRRGWARIGSIILACSLLPGVPIGTIIGVYLLRNRVWNRDESRDGAGWVNR